MHVIFNIMLSYRYRTRKKLLKYYLEIFKLSEMNF